jgi:hypothetical protein
MDKRTLALLSALSQPNNGQSQQALVEGLLSDPNTLNPKQQLVLQYLQQVNQLSAEEDNYVDEINNETMLEPGLMDEEHRPRSKQTKERIRRKIIEMQVELEELRHRNEVFAHALGACVCWGNDPECVECGGRGGPGYFEVNQELFEEFVKPAIKHLRTHENASGNSRGSQTVNRARSKGA